MHFFVSLPANYRFDPMFTNGLNNIKLRIMTKKELWELFKKTGKIEYYLEYKKK